MKVTNELLEDIVREVGPMVEEHTEWDLDNVKIEAISRGEYFEKNVKPFIDVLDSKDFKISFRDKILLYFNKMLIVGEYIPMTKSIYILPENINLKSNPKQLKTTIGHELVHKGQFERNPYFSQEWLKYMKQMAQSKRESPEWIEAKEKIAPYMTLAEGDATLIENILEMKYNIKDTSILSSSSKRVLPIYKFYNSLRKTNMEKEKNKQYDEGFKSLRNIWNTKPRKVINDLYNLESDELNKKLIKNKFANPTSFYIE